jgi:hypothetical protein
VAFSVNKFTLAALTPSQASKRFSTTATQPAHFIPAIAKDIAEGDRLFNWLFKLFNWLSNCVFVLAFAID